MGEPRLRLMALRCDQLATQSLRKMLWKKLKQCARLNGFLSFSVSPVNLWGLCGSSVLNIWVTRSLTAEMYPDVSNGSGTWDAWWDGEMSGYTERRGEETMKGLKWRGSGTVMYINHTLLMSGSGISQLPSIIIIHSDSHLFLPSTPPPLWHLFPFIYVHVISGFFLGQNGSSVLPQKMFCALCAHGLCYHITVISRHLCIFLFCFFPHK